MTKIEVLKYIVSEVAGKRPYKVAEVAYVADGKTKGMKVLDFVQRDVFQSLQDINPRQGDVLNVTFSQNDKGFWQFSTVEKGEKMGKSETASGGNAAVSGSSTSRGNWETAAERAARQVMIVRQSSLSNAIAYLNMVGNKKATGQEVITAAQEFEAYVLGTQLENGDDIV